MAIKSENRWPLSCLITMEVKKVGRWETESWQWRGVNLNLELTSMCDNSQYSQKLPAVSQALIPDQSLELYQVLDLYKDERTDYRFNLSSQSPKLFLALELLQSDSDPQIIQPKIACLTASQAVIACYMDTDYVVMSLDMPLPVQAWMEAFIGRHGELIEVKKKKREGAGRSNGN